MGPWRAIRHRLEERGGRRAAALRRPALARVAVGGLPDGAPRSSRTGSLGTLFLSGPLGLRRGRGGLRDPRAVLPGGADELPPLRRRQPRQRS